MKLTDNQILMNMEFKSISIAENKGYEFNNPIDICKYENGLISSSFGKAVIEDRNGVITGDLIIQPNAVAGNFDFQLFLAGKQIITILLCPTITT